MSIMRTKEGKPVGIPIWSSFDSRNNARSMENESMSSTFLSLSKSVSDMAEDREKDGKIVTISMGKRTFNIFLPHPQDDFQVSFVIVFEESDAILVKDKHKMELVHLVAYALRELNSFRDFLKGTKEQIPKDSSLYAQILDHIAEKIKKWDRKRVTRIREKLEEERRLSEEEERLAAEDEDEEPNNSVELN